MRALTSWKKHLGQTIEVEVGEWWDGKEFRPTHYVGTLVDYHTYRDDYGCLNKYIKLDEVITDENWGTMRRAEYADGRTLNVTWTNFKLA